MFMPESPQNSCIEVSQALICKNEYFLIQLRDFKSSIESPGHWGFFAGHIENGENPEQTMWRELHEELCWQPEVLFYLGNIVLDNHRTHVFRCEFVSDIQSLSLQEGVEIGIFRAEEIIKGQLYSFKRKQRYPITENSKVVFRDFNGIQGILGGYKTTKRLL